MKRLWWCGDKNYNNDDNNNERRGRFTNQELKIIVKMVANGPK